MPNLVYDVAVAATRHHSYIQTQHWERWKVRAVRDSERTADEQVIKAESAPAHPTGLGIG